MLRKMNCGFEHYSFNFGAAQFLGEFIQIPCNQDFCKPKTRGSGFALFHLKHIPEGIVGRNMEPKIRESCIFFDKLNNCLLIGNV